MGSFYGGSSQRAQYGLSEEYSFNHIEAPMSLKAYSLMKPLVSLGSHVHIRCPRFLETPIWFNNHGHSCNQKPYPMTMEDLILLGSYWVPLIFWDKASGGSAPVAAARSTSCGAGCYPGLALLLRDLGSAHPPLPPCKWLGQLQIFLTT